jgi:c-di-AMP phosphodiesterase-like protein
MTREENMLKDWLKGVTYSIIIPVIITVVTKNILIAIAYLAVLTFIYVFLVENKP